MIQLLIAFLAIVLRENHHIECNKIYMNKTEARALIATMYRDPSGAKEAMFDTDDFRAVIVGLIFIDRALQSLIQRHLHHEGAKLAENLSYAQKLEWALAFDEIDKPFQTALKKLAKLRNTFAHELSAVDSSFFKEVRQLPDMRLLAALLQEEGLANFNNRQDISDETVFIRYALLFCYLRLVRKSQKLRPAPPPDQFTDHSRPIYSS